MCDMTISLFLPSYFCRSFIRKQPTDSYVWHDPLFLDSSFAIDAVVCDKRALLLQVFYAKSIDEFIRVTWLTFSRQLFCHIDAGVCDKRVCALMQLCVTKEPYFCESLIRKKTCVTYDFFVDMCDVRLTRVFFLFKNPYFCETICLIQRRPISASLWYEKKNVSHITHMNKSIYSYL